MPTAIVRLKKNRELVGFYAYPNKSHLCWLVDQATDPHDCEYLSITEGGFHWPKRGSEKIFSDEYLNEENVDAIGLNFDNAEMDEILWQIVFENQDNWKSLV